MNNFILSKNDLEHFQISRFRSVQMRDVFLSYRGRHLEKSAAKLLLLKATT